MTNYTHPGQRATTSIGGGSIAAYDWQGNPLYTCCKGRAGCGEGNTNYVPKVNQMASIAAGPAVWQITEVDEHERTAVLISATSDYRTHVIHFRNLTVVECPDACPTCWSDLKVEGYPIRHQDAETGDPCPFTWARS